MPLSGSLDQTLPDMNVPTARYMDQGYSEVALIHVALGHCSPGLDWVIQEWI